MSAPRRASLASGAASGAWQIARNSGTRAASRNTCRARACSCRPAPARRGARARGQRSPCRAALGAAEAGRLRCQTDQQTARVGAALCRPPASADTVPVLPSHMRPCSEDAAQCIRTTTPTPPAHSTCLAPNRAQTRASRSASATAPAQGPRRRYTTTMSGMQASRRRTHPAQRAPRSAAGAHSEPAPAARPAAPPAPPAPCRRIGFPPYPCVPVAGLTAPAIIV
jgi:hypothetical protein